MVDFQLNGRTALVTGSTRGIGLAVADTLEQYGARVIRHNSRIADLASVEDTARLLAEAGAVDILVLNASCQHYRTMEEAFDEKEFAEQVNVNLRSSIQLVHGVLPGMKERRWGRVLAIGSINQWKQSPRLAVYAATKAALSNLMQNCARAYAVDGITFNTLAPGVIATDRNREALADSDTVERLLKAIPARRFGMPEDCAGAALLLCSEAGAYITGADIPVTGGMQL
ncbi:MAG: SDR family oxidoreductase [Kiritimatiellae bacterium]|nr:SDR family oxidoreductase [Kiritimatiellia bacterium]